MPLQPGKSDKAFSHNVRTEMEHGKPQKQSLAIAYAMKKKKAYGGDMHKADCPGCEMCEGGMMAEGGNVKGVHTEMDEPGFANPNRQSEAGVSLSAANKLKKTGNSMFSKTVSGLEAKAKDLHKQKLSELKSMAGQDRTNLAEGGEVEDEMESGYQPMPMGEPSENDDDFEDPMVAKYMKMYSKGGQVANDTPITAGFKPADYDDLALRDDDMEGAEYTGANSGDELGDDQEDEDRQDIVRRFMKSMAKKDRMPRPA